MKTDLSWFILAISIAIALAANHEGRNPWIWGGGAFILMTTALFSFLIWLEGGFDELDQL